MMNPIRQVTALIWKNLLVTAVRRPVAIFVSFYAIPITLLAVLCLLPTFFYGSSVYGEASPQPVKSVQDALSKPLAIVQPSGLGSDVQRVIDTITKPLGRDKLIFLDSEDKIRDACTDCVAAVTFLDSPGTKENHTWSYSIRTVRPDDKFDATKHDSQDETVLMPLQLAINNAIANKTTVPDVFMFSRSPSSEAAERESTKLEFAGTVYTFVIFACFLPVIYQLTRWISEERESGMSQLVDSMGGSFMLPTRVLSWVLAADLLCLPLFIAFGIVYWRTLFHSSDGGVLVGWQILLGFSVISSTVFAAAFFRRARVSAIMVCTVFLAISISTQLYITRQDPEPMPPLIITLVMLFPASSHSLFMKQMVFWQMAQQKAELSKFPPGSEKSMPDVYAITQTHVLLGVVAQMVVYPLLAILVEWATHGISFHRRSFSQDGQNAVASATGLKKYFGPGFWKTVCCCCCKARRRTVKAVTDVQLHAHKGQIMCLAGPNGSGKTTTLHMLAGFIRPTSGTISFAAAPSQIGICPQANTLWDNLTVRQHVRLWCAIKAANATPGQVDDLIETCNLTKKTNSLAGTLSGGQKRKLQLACMFAGDPTVCLIDEVTSGLDPISRRVIWDTLLAKRANRSIIFTTHFLDEVDVLADDIVMLTEGRVKCQGTPAELYSRYGGGYRVITDADDASIPWASVTRNGSTIYSTPDSRTASDVAKRLGTNGAKTVTVAGPQFEDVFLNLSDTKPVSHTEDAFQMTSGRTTTFVQQVGFLILKRFKVLPRFWWPYVFAVILVLGITPALSPIMTDVKESPCRDLVPTLNAATINGPMLSKYCAQNGGCDRLILGPKKANDTLYDIFKRGFEDLKQVDADSFGAFTVPVDTRDQWYSELRNRNDSSHNGIFADDKPVIAFQPRSLGSTSGFEMMNLWSEMTSGIQISAKRGNLPKIDNNVDGNKVAYTIFLMLLQAVYPAVFVLYPAIEKNTNVRSLQYANGVLRGATIVAHAAFDSFWVFLASLFATIFVQASTRYWHGNPWDMLGIFLLYGLCMILIGLMITRYVKRPLKAFMAAFAVYIAIFIIVAVVNSTMLGKPDSTIMSAASGMGVFFPLANVYRALSVGLNIGGQGCTGNLDKPSSSFSGTAGPATLLLLQLIAFTLLCVYLEGGFAVHRGQRRSAPDVFEMHMRSTDNGIEKEAVRVEQGAGDLLKAVHVSKAFGSNLAVDDVTFGIPSGEVIALLGPNGAGKSTLVNIIQSELHADKGQVLLCDEDSRAVTSRKHLGVCPQYDALDLLTTQQHLVFYAQIKGVTQIKENVDFIMAKLGLAPHAKTMAANLSGGNKRKLSLAIALIGAPSVLVLDEPTTAMDAVAKRAFWEIIRSISAQRSVLITTHSMEEADALASRATILAKKMLAIGTPQSLRTRFSDEYHVCISLASSATRTQMERVLGMIQWEIEDVELEREMLRGQIRFTMPASSAAQTLNVVALSQMLEDKKSELGIQYYSIACATLEDAFINAVRANDVEEEDHAARTPAWRGILKKSSIGIKRVHHSKI